MQDGSLPLNMILDQVGRDKGIDKTILVEAIEAAILTAAKRTFGPERDLEARFNEETGAVDVYQYMIVVNSVENEFTEISAEDAKSLGLDSELGEELGFQIFYRDEDSKLAKQQDKEFGKILNLKTVGRGFGRIAAQTAKQVIIQRVRDAEREIVFNEYKDRQGEVIAGTVRRFEKNNIIVDLGRTEAVIPGREQAPRESYRPGDRILAYVKKIDKDARGSQVQLSRTDDGLLLKLFEMEVPEIYEGIVSIYSAAREPGSRSKIAVTSRDADVDPVGACVGMRGARVQAVVQELRGEKIDIVPWDSDPARFVCNAIQPAEVSRVMIDEANNSMELVVADDKLSLAIGRHGQNVRLASQLTGWRLDVISDTDFAAREEAAITALSTVEGISENVARTMYKLGFRTIEEVAEAERSELSIIPGMGDIDALQSAALLAMETERMRKVKAFIKKDKRPTARERMYFVKGIGERTIELLIEAGYRKVENLAAESDMDKLALSTGLSVDKVTSLVVMAKEFLENEQEIVSAIEEQIANEPDEPVLSEKTPSDEEKTDDTETSDGPADEDSRTETVDNGSDESDTVVENTPEKE